MATKPTGTVSTRAMLGSAGVDVVTWSIELAVGVACLAIAVVAFRAGRLRAIGVVLVVAGLAAAGHATLRLATSG
jgi:hypothetical protein